MPRAQSTKVEKSFIRGLVTDVTALQFPENASTDTDNCVFDFTGRVTRRLGIDLEEGYTLVDGGPVVDTDVVTEFLWEAVAGTEKSFAVVQNGSAIGFYDVSTSPLFGDLHTTIDLNAHLPSGSGLDPGAFNCQYATGRGTLVIVNPSTNPLFVVYDPVEDTITTTSFEIKTRDFAGLDDDLAVTERPTATAAGLASSNPEHYYNILNQGWTTTDALSQWDSARADMPSNADYVALYRASVTDAFDNARVLSLSPLSRPAVKGHFILTVTNPDRNAAMVAEGFVAAIGSTSSVIGPAVGTTIASGVTGAGIAFDGSTNTTVSSCAFLTAGANSYIGKNYSSSPKKIAQAIVYGSNDRGFMNVNQSMTWTMYANQNSPVNSTDGTILGSVTFTDSGDESAGRIISSSDLATSWNYVWLKQNLASTGASDPYLAEVQFYQSDSTTEAPDTIQRPSCVAFYSSRLFYAGIEAFSLNNTIFFTPILEKESQYGECYQLNDPTGEYFFDLLASDGGTIVIPEIGKITRLVNCKNALIVIATNGVWAISGSAGQYFRANDYQVKKISTIGSVSPLSIVDSQGLPVWWGQEGIYSLKFDVSYDAFELTFQSVGIVDFFFNEIPTENRKYVKGVYSSEDYKIFWLFYDGELGDDKYIYNRVLVYDVRTKAYYPWTFNAPIGTLNIRGALFIQSADRTGSPGVRYIVTYEPTAGNQSITSAVVADTVHRDWFTFDDEVEDIDGAQEYDSFFITGYYIPGDAMRFAQGNYVFTLLEQQDEDDSCFMQGVFDYATSGNAGKWSQRQEIYTSFMEDRSLVWRKLKLRGKGRSIQLRYSSNGTKPFTIIGWAIPITTDQAV